MSKKPITTAQQYLTIEVKWTISQHSSLLSLSLDDSRTTLGECLGRTRWSPPLDWTTYLYYFYKWLYTTSPRSHVLLEYSTITWPCHVIWLLKFPCYLYLVSIVWLDVYDQVFEHMGNFFLLRALITFLFSTWTPNLFNRLRLRTCHDLAKQLSYCLYFFSFLFLLDLLHKGECEKVSHDQRSYITKSQVIVIPKWHHMR